jgi:hypothetical protein
MRAAHPSPLFALMILVGPVTLSAAGLVPTNVTVGQNLETEAVVTLDAEAPSDGLLITLTSDDSSRVLLSRAPDAIGSASISVRVTGGRRVSPEFYVQGLTNSGMVTYTASAAGYGNATGAVTLVRSGVVIAGPSKFGNPLVTNSGFWPSVITVYSAQLDSSGNFSAVRQVRGGSSATVRISSSNTSVGTITSSPVTITGGSFSATAQFQPLSEGNTTLLLDTPSGFNAPAQFARMTATVNLPGLAVTDKISLGANLETRGTLLLGAPAAQGGVAVTLTSDDSSRLLLSGSATVPGSKSITVMIESGASSGSYYLQALDDSGTVSYSASTARYRSATGTIAMAPSGIFLTGPAGAPDEAEVLRPEAPEFPHGFFGSLTSGKTTPIVVYTAYLDPKTHRGADITIQPLRAGISLKVSLKNSNPVVGVIPDSVTIMGGSDQGGTQFTALVVGSTVLSVTTPAGFTASSNATTLTAVVRE